MKAELLNLSLFISAIAKVLLMTGVGVGGAVALFAECCGFRVVALGIEMCGGVHAERLNGSDAGNRERRSVSNPARTQVRAGQLAIREKVPASFVATSPARKVRRYA